MVAVSWEFCVDEEQEVGAADVVKLSVFIKIKEGLEQPALNVAVPI